MEFLGDGVMWNLISVHLEMVLVSVQDRHMVCAKTYHRLRNHFGHTRWYSLVTRLKWKLISVHVEIVLILTQIGACFAPNVPWAQKSLWMRPMKLLHDMGHVESRFDPFGNDVSVGARCTVCAKHSIGSEIIFDAPDSTHR